MDTEYGYYTIAQTSDVEQLKKWHEEYPKGYNVNQALVRNKYSPQALIKDIADNIEENITTEWQRNSVLTDILSLPNVPPDVMADALKNKKDSFPYWGQVALFRIMGTADCKAQLSRDEIDFYRQLNPYVGFCLTPSFFKNNLEYLVVKKFLNDNGFLKREKPW